MELDCLLCDLKLTNQVDKQNYLQHLLKEHKFVIADVELICDFEKYVAHWEAILKKSELDKYCSKIKTNTGPSDKGVSEDFWLLSDFIEEDRDLRRQLHHNRLKKVLALSELERNNDNFQSECLFCHTQITGNRRRILDHMNEEHSFYIGKADDTVYIKEFLDYLREKLETLHCLYCDKIFKDKLVLKEHMRKKLHKKIKSSDTFYDQFYLVNYLELGKNWNTIKEENDSQLEREFAVESDLNISEESGVDDEEVCELREDAKCLFCNLCSSTGKVISEHMETDHNFSLENIRSQLHLDFYDLLKLVNFIRRKVSNNVCYRCQMELSSHDALMSHLSVGQSEGSCTYQHCDFSGDNCEQRLGLPKRELWDRPEYFFMVSSSDVLLCDDEFNNLEESSTVATNTLDRNQAIPADLDPEIVLSVENSVLRDPAILQDCLSN